MKILNKLAECKQWIIPRILRYLNPNYSYCSKCGLPWNWCKSKTVMISETSGTFATCEYCWDTSTLEELKQYYTETYMKQKKSLFGTDFKMEHTLKHLLKCVEVEYNLTHKV